MQEPLLHPGAGVAAQFKLGRLPVQQCNGLPHSELQCQGCHQWYLDGVPAHQQYRVPYQLPRACT